MKNIILKGKCNKGLYPLPANPVKQACGAARVPLSRWHSRLGHPAPTIVKQIVSSNSLSSLGESSSKSVCDACQQAKSHLSPYSRSSGGTCVL